MPLLLHPCKCSILNPTFPLFNSVVYSTATQFPVLPTSTKAKTSNPHSGSSKNLAFSSSSSIWRLVQVPLCSKQETYEEFRSAELPAKVKGEELELLNKPSPKPIEEESDTGTQEESEKPSKDELLEPFHRLFSQTESLDEKGVSEVGSKDEAVQEGKKVTVEYFEPKPGDFVVGVVVSGNDRKLDVNIGADLLGVMLTKDVLPLHGKEMGHLLCDLEKDAEKVMVGGKVGIVKNDEALSGEPMLGKPVVDPGTVLFAEVLGRTLSGRPLLSSRRLFRRMAWHRVRQVLFSLYFLFIDNINSFFSPEDLMQHHKPVLLSLHNMVRTLWI